MNENEFIQAGEIHLNDVHGEIAISFNIIYEPEVNKKRFAYISIMGSSSYGLPTNAYIELCPETGRNHLSAKYPAIREINGIETEVQTTEYLNSDIANHILELLKNKLDEAVF